MNLHNCRGGLSCTSTMMDCTYDLSKNITHGCTNLCENSTTCSPQCVNNDNCRSFCDAATTCTATYENSNNGQVTCDEATTCEMTFTNSNNFYADCNLVSTSCAVTI